MGGAAGHSEHFLRRLDRVADHHVELALTLYRDTEMLREVLSRAGVDGHAGRVAISLDDEHEGPFVIVTREGRFVTCLARGMRVSEGDVVVVAKARLDAAISKVERMREEVARVSALVESGADGVAARAFARMRDEGFRFCREDAEQLLEVWPLVGEEAALILGSGVRHVAEGRERMSALRWQKLRPVEIDALVKYAQLAWSCSNLLVLVDHPVSMRVLDSVMPELNGVHPVLFVATPLFDLGTMAFTTRALWAVARRAGKTLPWIKGLRESTATSDRMFREMALATCALASRKHRAEAIKALTSEHVLAELDPATDPYVRSAHEIGMHMAGMVRGVVDDPTSFDSIGLLAARRCAYSLCTGRPPEDGADVSVVPPDVARAWMTSIPFTMLDNQSAWLVPIVAQLPHLARAQAAELFLPREMATRIPPSPLDWARHMMEAYANENHLRRVPTARREAPKVGRNDPCPCGSGKKAKRCCAA